MCGCGRKTAKALGAFPSRGYAKGDHVRYIKGHQPASNKVTDIEPPNPSGLCMCGCGLTTPIARYSWRAKGIRVGEHRRYCRGHSGSKALYVEDPVSSCWEWTGTIRKDGYASGAQHRLYYVRAKGPIPAGLELDHLCNNKRCVNPDHLEPVTHAENVRRACERRKTFGGLRPTSYPTTSGEGA